MFCQRTQLRFLKIQCHLSIFGIENEAFSLSLPQFGRYSALHANPSQFPDKTLERHYIYSIGSLNRGEIHRKLLPSGCPVKLGALLPSACEDKFTYGCVIYA
jgi:hypothetical protein